MFSNQVITFRSSVENTPNRVSESRCVANQGIILALDDYETRGQSRENNSIDRVSGIARNPALAESIRVDALLRWEYLVSNIFDNNREAELCLFARGVKQRSTSGAGKTKAQECTFNTDGNPIGSLQSYSFPIPRMDLYEAAQFVLSKFETNAFRWQFDRVWLFGVTTDNVTSYGEPIDTK